MAAAAPVRPLVPEQIDTSVLGREVTQRLLAGIARHRRAMAKGGEIVVRIEVDAHGRVHRLHVGSEGEA